MLINLGPLAKGRHGVNRCSPQAVEHSQKADMSSSLDIVRKLYPQNLKHIRNQLRCDKNARTLNVSEKGRYWTINPMHVGVELLDKHERTCDWDVTQWLPSPTVNDRGKVSVSKVWQNDLAFRMNALSREVLRKCLKAIIITEPDVKRWRIRRQRSIGTKRVPGWSGFMFKCHKHDQHKQKGRERKKK